MYRSEKKLDFEIAVDPFINKELNKRSIAILFDLASTSVQLINQF
jgi:hypothetical protein